MAFVRPVLIENIVYRYHDVSSIEHTRYETLIHVNSYEMENGGGRGITSEISMEQDLTMNDFVEAENYIKNHPAFAKYSDATQIVLDEVLSQLTDEQAESFKQWYSEWESGVSYNIGSRVRYDGELYRCIQAHTSQSDWTPDISTSLFVRVSPEQADDDPTTIPTWVQPIGTEDAYNIGDRVIFDGEVYESLIDANVWSPTDYPGGWQHISS